MIGQSNFAKRPTITERGERKSVCNREKEGQKIELIKIRELRKERYRTINKKERDG